MNLDERLIRDAKSFAAEVEDFDEEKLVARVFATLGITADDDSASDGAPAAAGHGHVAGPAKGPTSAHEGSSCTTTRH